MKQFFRHHFLIGFLVLTTLFSLLPSQVFAAGETIYLSPASGSSKPGNTFTVSIDGHTGSMPWFGGAHSVTGSLTFPANRLKVVDGGIDYTNTAFSKNKNTTVDNDKGIITINQGNDWWINSSDTDVHIFSVTFQALTAGAAPISFKDVRYYYGWGSDSAPAAMTGGTYTITSPPKPTPKPTPSPKPSKKPTPTKKPVASPKPSPSPSKTPAPEETPDPIAESDGGLNIENVKITATRTENRVAWSINSTKAKPTFLYGTDRNSQQEFEGISTEKDGEYAVALEDLLPGTLYYFTIKAATTDNLLGATYSGVLTTRGYPVQLTVEQNNLLIPGAKVVIDGRSFVANNNAIITTELRDGTLTASITPPGGGKSQEAQFTVKKLPVSENKDPELQSFVLSIATTSSAANTTSSLTPIVLSGAAALLALVGGGTGFFLYKKRQQDLQTAEVGVDSDLLMASYGNDVIEQREHTPAPNLEAASNTLFQSQQQTEAPPQTEIPYPIQADDANTPSNVSGISGIEAAPPNTMPPAALEYTSTQTVEVPPPETVPTPAPPPEVTTAESVTQAREVTAPAPIEQPSPIQSPAPEPVHPETQEVQATATVEAPADTGATPLPEEYSEEVTRVESSENTVDEGPSAVYNEETGELAILHHRRPTSSTTLGGQHA